MPPLLATTLLTLALCIALGGCASQRSEGFAIYLLSPDVPPDSLAILSHVGIEDSPFLAVADIVSGEDPREDPTVIQALEKAGKLTGP